MKLFEIKDYLDSIEANLSILKNLTHIAGVYVRTLAKQAANNQSGSISEKLRIKHRRAKIDYSQLSRDYKNETVKYEYQVEYFIRRLLKVLCLPEQYLKNPTIYMDRYEQGIKVFFGYEDYNSEDHHLGRYYINLYSGIMLRKEVGDKIPNEDINFGRLAFLSNWILKMKMKTKKMIKRNMMMNLKNILMMPLKLNIKLRPMTRMMNFLIISLLFV